MLSFADMLKAPFERPVAKTRKPPAKNGAILKARSHGRYRLVMEHNELTTGEIASRRGISHMGCLSTLYEMEKLGLIERAGTQPIKGNGNPTIIWRWKNESVAV